MDEIVINGVSRQIDRAMTLTEVLKEMGLGTRWVLVERNGEPIEREQFASTLVEPGDRLEVAAPMAGG